ncbi:hypothetical protein DFH27DRAFT_612740 [Peziza echinospora]|nr:hypothetical protein DFH27DRAFT_612740 [Peziza echinospora]
MTDAIEKEGGASASRRSAGLACKSKSPSARVLEGAKVRRVSRVQANSKRPGLAITTKKGWRQSTTRQAVIHVPVIRPHSQSYGHIDTSTLAVMTAAARARSSAGQPAALSSSLPILMAHRGREEACWRVRGLAGLGRRQQQAGLVGGRAGMGMGSVHGGGFTWAGGPLEGRAEWELWGRGRGRREGKATAGRHSGRHRVKGDRQSGYQLQAARAAAAGRFTEQKPTTSRLATTLHDVEDPANKHTLPPTHSPLARETFAAVRSSRTANARAITDPAHTDWAFTVSTERPFKSTHGQDRKIHQDDGRRKKPELKLHFAGAAKASKISEELLREALEGNALSVQATQQPAPTASLVSQASPNNHLVKCRDRLPGCVRLTGVEADHSTVSRLSLCQRRYLPASANPFKPFHKELRMCDSGVAS